MTKGQENNLTHHQAHTYLHLGRDQLEAAEQQALDHHLAGCIACRHYAVEAADLQSRLTRSMRLRWQSQPPRPVLNDQVQTRLRRKIWLRQVGRFANSVGAAVALCLLVVGLGWLAWRIRPVPDTLVAETTAPASPQPPGPSRGDWSTLPGLATFGDQAKLLGYRVSAISFAPGETIGLSLYWQTRSTGYTFFVHLLDADDRVVAQADASETEAACPQVSHSTNLVVTCATLALPQSLSAGTYQVKVGVTNQVSGQRLTTTPAGQESIWLTSLQIGSLPTPTPTPTPYPIPASCPVTLPNGNPPPGEPPSPNHHGNGQVWTILRPNGVLVPPDKVQPEGKLSADWSWWHSQAGQLTITGRRLDDLAAPSLEAEITPGLDDTGFQGSRLIFPSTGCWEVTGRVGNSTLTFVTWVVKK